jgi:S-formylglutathione hydrolase FrmB
LPRIRAIDVTITGWGPFRIGLLALLVLGLLLVVREARQRRTWRTLLSAGLVVVLLAANVLTAVNSYYGYFRTLGQALGVVRDLQPQSALDRATVPANGIVVRLPVPGNRSGFAARDAYVYVPPAWFHTPKPILPVVMLLHGLPGDPSGWVTSGEAQTAADAYARDHDGRAPILVMPDILGGFDNDTECVDSVRGNVETYLTEDVPATVVPRLGAAPPGPQWAVAGFSLGGMCSLMLALRHPDLFPTFGDYGGLLGPRTGDDNDIGTTVADLFAGDEQAFQAHEPRTLLSRRRYAGTAGWFEMGADDTLTRGSAQELAPLARAAGIETCFVVVPGFGHVGEVWRRALRDSLPWLAARTGLTPQQPSDTSKCQKL